MKCYVNLFGFFFKAVTRAGEEAQQLRSQAVLPKDQGSIPNTYMAPYNHLSLWFQGI